MQDKAIITSASNKFFPSLLNLLGSLRAVYPSHPRVTVYDFGLTPLFRRELKSLPFVSVEKIPPFTEFWRSCYTWKTYILSRPLARLNLYLDAGIQVLRPLDDLFDIIDRENFLAVGQQTPLADITPAEYKLLFPVEEKFYAEQCVTAGIFGFKKDSAAEPVLRELYQAALAGLALGFSPAEQRRNRGVNRSQFVRGCKLFRHDTTLLSLLMRKHFKDFKIRDCAQYGGPYSNRDHHSQYLWNMRLNYKKLDYLDRQFLHQKFNWPALINRLIIKSMLAGKRALKLAKSGK